MVSAGNEANRLTTVPPMQIHVTKHAILRYRQRVENCSIADAVERIRHAVEIGRQPTAKQLRQIGTLRGVYFWCEVESLMLICERRADEATGEPRGGLSVVTLFRIPSDAEIEGRTLRKRRKIRLRRKPVLRRRKHGNGRSHGRKDEAA
jgi:hypothetical protein